MVFEIINLYKKAEVKLERGLRGLEPSRNLADQ
jgi:hypothetical protein